jgi:hypothetical protein
LFSVILLPYPETGEMSEESMPDTVSSSRRPVTADRRCASLSTGHLRKTTNGEKVKSVLIFLVNSN